MLQSIAEDLWVVDGPSVSFMGFPYPTRMAIVRLPSGALWVWSPVGLDDALAAEVAELGEVKHLVEPNKIHHLALLAWKERWPDARMYAPPGLAGRFEELKFDAELGDAPEPAFEGAIEHVIVHGSFVMEEVLFFHSASRTLFVGDLVQKHDPASLDEKAEGRRRSPGAGLASFARWQAWVMKLDGMVGPDGSTPREWRATFLQRDKARAAIEHALAWKPERMVIAHGEWAHEDGEEAFRSSMSWLVG